MMYQKRITALTMILIATMLLAGCNAPGQGAAPTLDPLAIEAMVNATLTQDAQLAAANQTSTAALLPTNTITATPTLEPTSTATLEPTATVMPPTATNTWVPATQKPVATSTPNAYSCSLLSTSPATDTKININTDFDAVWKVKNSGTKDWEVGYVDLRYVSGTKMQTGADVFDMKNAVLKGEELTLTVDMKTPSTAGKYTAAWVLMMEGTTMCTLTVNIEAVTP